MYLECTPCGEPSWKAVVTHFYLLLIVNIQKSVVKPFWIVLFMKEMVKNSINIQFEKCKYVISRFTLVRNDKCGFSTSVYGKGYELLLSLKVVTHQTTQMKLHHCFLWKNKKKIVKKSILYQNLKKPIASPKNL